MNGDPFSILGVSQSASEDEIKSAYRKLAKKYHPDVNQGSASSEDKMKEINEAYSEAIRIKRGGGTYSSQSQRQPGGGASGAGYGYREPNEGYGFDPFGFGFDFGGARRYQAQRGTPELRHVRELINAGRYQEAMNELQSTNVRSAEWFFLSAAANLGAGKRVAAQSYAKQAAQMEPDNYEYAELYSRLENNGQSYRTTQRANFGGMPLTYCSSPCAWCCILQLVCRFCGYGRGFFCC